MIDFILLKLRYNNTRHILLAFLLSFAMSPVITQSMPYCTKHARMDRSRINIGVYHLQPYATDEPHIRDLKDCGIDFVLCMRDERPALDLLYKYGVGAILYDVLPQWWPKQKKNGQMKNIYPMEMYIKAAKKWKDHPAVWAMDLGDEPSALDFAHCADVMRKMEEQLANQFIYLCLYPNYASVTENTTNQALSQLGTSTYAEHIKEYCRLIPADYLCYDYYVYSSKTNANKVPKYFENLQVTADACTATNRSLWITLQVNSKLPELWISLNQLRYQAYTSMAFGAENIIWACYTGGWWTNQVIDSAGNKTEQYPKLQQVNKEIHALSPVYMKYRRASTSFVGFDNTPWLKGSGIPSAAEHNDGVFAHLHATDHSPLVIGSMLSRNADGTHAVFICSADDPKDKAPCKHTLHYTVAPGQRLKAHSGEGEVPVRQIDTDTYSITIQSCQGILIEAI